MPPVALAILVGGAALAVSLAPGWFDAPELSAAIDGLGVSHPTGHPLYLLAAKPWTWLPLGSVAFRTSLFSLACHAAAAALALRVVNADRARPTSAWAATLALALVFLMPALALSATRTETYAPALALCAAMFALFAAHERHRDARHFLALSFVFGLSLSLHPVMALAAAPLPVLAARHRPRSVPLALALAGAGLGVELYLPLRAAAEPALNWGAPSNLRSLMHVLSGADFAVFSADRLKPWPFLRTAAGLAGSLALLLALVGFVHKRSSVAHRAGLAVLALNLALAWKLGLYPGNPDSFGYLAPAFWIVGLGAMAGLARTAALPVAPATRWIGGVGIGATLLAATARDAFPLWRAHGGAAAPLARSALEAAPPAATLYVESDHWIFPAWYAQQVERVRPDVLVVATGLARARWYRDRLRARHSAFHRAESYERPAPGAASYTSAAFAAPDAFLRHCRESRATDRFGFAEGMCAQILRARFADLAGARRYDEALAFLGEGLGVPPMARACTEAKPIALPFRLESREARAFLPTYAALRSEYLLMRLSCFGPASVREALAGWPNETADDRAWRGL